MSRTNRIWVALFVVLGLLMSQLAVSAYACGSEQDPEAALCQQHCQYGDAADAIVKTPPAIDLTVGQGVRVQHFRDASSALASVGREVPPPPEPPPAIRFAVLRI